jgi:hypothetical protein
MIEPGIGSRNCQILLLRLQLLLLPLQLPPLPSTIIDCETSRDQKCSSATENTTGDEPPPQEENDSGDQKNNTSDDESEQETVQQRTSGFRHKTDLEIRGQTQLSGDSDTGALECLTE